MKVLVAMSGGVDSSVAASILLQSGHEVVGATMKLWGGKSDTGCCSVSDVEDARRVAAQLGISHHVFNFTEEFDEKVVAPYVSAHANALTPNPCIECNRHIKFDRFFDRAVRLGFEAIATGHHARVRREEDGDWQLLRGQDPAKDQSYVLSMLGQQQLARLLLPVGEMHKTQVREIAQSRNLRTAAKPDSQDVCFIGSKIGRSGFLGDRIGFTPGLLVDHLTGETVGSTDALELLTVGQRRGVSPGTSPDKTPQRRYVVDVDLGGARAAIGSREHLDIIELELGEVTWTNLPLNSGEQVTVQTSAHGVPMEAFFEQSKTGDSSRAVLRFYERQRKVAPGQTAAMYRGDRVIGAGKVSNS